MNILFVHSIGKRKFGGGEKWLITAASGLRDNGHRVFVGGCSHSRLLTAASERNLETVEFNIFSDLSVYHVFRIASFIRRNKIDAVITRGRDLAVAGTAARIAGNPIVLVRHGLPLRSSIRKHSFLLKRLADGIITNTRTIKDLYETKGWVERDFTRVIYNGAIAGNNLPVYDFAARFPGKKIILSVGRLALQKGYHYLIDAVSLLGRERDDLMFMILGEGKLYRKLLAYAEKKGVSHLLHFEGFVDNVAPYLKGCDIFVLPSLYEGMPNAAMEAMALGKPVILADVNGAGELIPGREMGIRIPPRDPHAIADAVKELLDNSGLCDELGSRAREHVLEKFPVEAMISGLESYINEKLAAKSGLT